MEYIQAKTIVTKTKSSEWFGIDYNMNIYKGCCHGCIYCDSRSECYRIEHFDQVRAKKDALLIIRDELRRKIRTGIIGTGSMSDPYNPFEKELQLTRHALELIDAFGFGVAIATKSPLITRDIDILTSIMEHSPVLCKITITSLDDELSKKIEPGVAVSSKRFEAIKELSEHGIYTGILLMPVLPFLEDNEENIRGIIEKADECGAKFIYPAFGVTLRQNQREWYYDKLRELFPEQNLVSEYTNKYGNYYECHSPKAKKLYLLLEEECKKRGILYKMEDIKHSYKQKYQMTQLSLFDD
ncbi:SPL family radical SAM protein [Anaeromicropila herbilytica]|uniref:Radical SAM protein n=1 Tax=Anaeromicropila herbilytica TaxID=2785025 RepID=A0A7R7ELV7_9FIRM|nr:radical SAM protein [Anaeromicropila herbilytica]BCN31275.1 radical SAM protein [Anaeromicropila herbilytica]